MTAASDEWESTLKRFRDHACDHMSVSELDQGAAELRDSLSTIGIDLTNQHQFRAFAAGFRTGIYYGASKDPEEQAGYLHILATFYKDPT